MGIRAKIEIGIAAALAAVLCFAYIQQKQIGNLKAERDRYRDNTAALLYDVQTYRVLDSLSAARVQSLELTLSEFKRFRADDARLIDEMAEKNRDLVAINKTQAQTIYELRAAPRDTTIIRDTIPVQAVAVHCGDAWYDFDGVLTADEFTGTLASRDSLVVAESVKYGRFLGFLWKTKRVKDRRVDVASKNPHTTIIGVEHIIIAK